MQATKDGPFLALAKKCSCGASFVVRPSLAWVNWMRSMTRQTGSEFSGKAFSHQCRCGRVTFIDADDLYLEGVLEETG